MNTATVTCTAVAAMILLTACGAGAPPPPPPDPGLVTGADIGTTWLMNDTRAGGAVATVEGPDAPPLGVGSLQLTTTDSAGGSAEAKAQLFIYDYGSLGDPDAGVALADLTSLSFWAYRSSASTNSSAQTVSLNIEVDFVGDGSSFTTLVFEPVYNAQQQSIMDDTWQQWDCLDGGNAVWWSTSAIPGVCAFSCFVSWDVIVAMNPDARVKFGLGFNVGSGWSGDFAGAADALTVGVNGTEITYDFEP